MQNVDEQMKDAFSPESNRELAELETKAVALRQQLRAVEDEIRRNRERQIRAFRTKFNG